MMYTCLSMLPKKKSNISLKHLLRCEGQPKGNVRVVVTNGLKEIVIDNKTSETGYLDIEPMRMNQRYRLQLGDMDPSLYTKCVLQILDTKGNVVKELRFNAMGICDLELLPLNYADLNLRPLEDGSLLTIQLEGQLYTEQPGDIGRGEPITILDDKGDPVAIAFTNETGKFKFTDVQPDLNYRFKLAEESKAQNVLITDKGEKIVLPVLDAEVNYQRLNQSEAILLINEFNETIYVSPKDVFVINRIYYEYNSAKLTPEAQAQLDQLALLMEKNTDIKLELRSHTDSRGKDEFNLTLSKKRAESAVTYLSGKKIASSRFTPLGLGETQLINECDDGIECSEPEHTINRRTEIKITK
jgi:outer membrane protein OmpA-like peptidoglycan-associated protein